MSNEQRLYHFLVGLLKGDMDHLDRFEDEIDSGEEEFLLGEISDALGKISLWRRELLRLKHYYEQLDTVFDEMKANDNGFLSEKMLAKAEILSARNDRYLDKIKSLQEIVAQLRETYQSELAIQQNNLMKSFYDYYGDIFAVIAACRLVWDEFSEYAGVRLALRLSSGDMYKPLYSDRFGLVF